MDKLDKKKDKLIDWILNHLDVIFSILRWIKPIIVFKGQAYVTRFDDVSEVLERDWIFHVPYAEKMHNITDGGNFFLGMQNTEKYTRDVSNMRLTVSREDINKIITPFVDHNCTEILAASNGNIDVVQELSRVVPTRLIGKYFGTPGWDEIAFADAATIMFQYLFYPDDDEVEKSALSAAKKMRQYLEQEITKRKQKRYEADDVLERCLKLQDAEMPGMSDLDIRNNLIGLITGAIPTTSKCVAITLNYLLQQPELLVTAQQAAQADDDALMVQYVQESLRLNPFAPGIRRVCAEKYVVAKGTLRSTKIPKGAIVLAATQSAMMDKRRVDRPSEFHLDRPSYIYKHFGHGLHTCFGQYINLAQIPAIVKAVLKQKGLRRASEMKSIGPFPTSLKLEFDI